MSDTTNSLLGQIALAMAPMLVALAGWAAKKLADYVNAHVKSTLLAGILTRLDFAVLNAVQAIEQTMEAAPPDQKKAAAIAAAKSYLGSKGLDEALKILGLTSSDGEQMIATHVEAAVMKLGMKQDAIAAATSEPAAKVAVTGSAPVVVVPGPQ